MTDVEQGSAPASHRVAVDGLTYRVLEWGTRGAPAVLLLHGLRSYAHTWDRLGAELSATHHVLAPDFRGRGESSWDPDRSYHTETYVQDLEQVVQAFGLRRFALVGHSMGGTVGYVYAARHPDQVQILVVEDIGPGSSDDTAGAARIRREVSAVPQSFASLAEVRAYWRDLRPDITDEALESRIAHTVRPDSTGRWTWSLDMAGIAAARLGDAPGQAVDLWACVDALACPTLVLRGADSDFLPADTCRRMADRQPKLCWREVSEAGHYVHDDNPETYIALVKKFLDGAAW